MSNDLSDGDPTGRVLTAWVAKEELRALLAIARTGGQRHYNSHRLHRFNSWYARQPARAPTPRRDGPSAVAETLAFLQARVTNAGTEATNRTVKTAAPPAASVTLITNAAEYWRLFLDQTGS
ncbi:MAG: hypothetical protein ACR2LE_00110 [Nocardioidaceae bacterium]